MGVAALVVLLPPAVTSARAGVARTWLVLQELQAVGVPRTRPGVEVASHEYGLGASKPEPAISDAGKSIGKPNSITTRASLPRSWPKSVTTRVGKP